MHEGVYGPELPSVRCSTCKRRNDKGTQHAHIEHKVLLLHEQRTQSNVVCVSVNHCLRLESLRAQQQRSQRFDRRLVLKLLTNVDLQVATNRHSLTNLCRTELSQTARLTRPTLAVISVLNVVICQSPIHYKVWYLKNGKH